MGPLPLLLIVNKKTTDKLQPQNTLIMRIESRIGHVRRTPQTIYAALSDFNRLSTNMLPQDKISNLQVTEDSCSFDINNAGHFGMRVIDREPFKTVKIAATEDSSIKFTMWIQMKEFQETDSAVKVTLDAELNMLLGAVAKGPLTKFVNSIVDNLERI